MRVKQSGKKKLGMEVETPESTPETASPVSPKPKSGGKEKKPKPTQGLRRSTRAAALILAQNNAKLTATSADNPVVVPDEPVEKSKPTKSKKGDLMDLVDAATSKISPEEEPKSTDAEEEHSEGQSEEPKKSLTPEEEDTPPNSPVKSIEAEVEESTEECAVEDQIPDYPVGEEEAQQREGQESCWWLDRC